MYNSINNLETTVESNLATKVSFLCCLKAADFSTIPKIFHYLFTIPNVRYRNVPETLKHLTVYLAKMLKP